MVSHALPMSLVNRPVRLEDVAETSRLYAKVTTYGKLVAAGRSPDGLQILSYKFGVLRLLRIRADATDSGDMWVVNVLADTRLWPKAPDVARALVLYCGFYELPLDPNTSSACVRHFIDHGVLKFSVGPPRLCARGSGFVDEFCAAPNAHTGLTRTILTSLARRLYRRGRFEGEDR